MLQYSEAYLEPSQTFTMEFFGENSLQLKAIIIDVRLGSKYVSSVNHQMSYFTRRTFRKSGP